MHLHPIDRKRRIEHLRDRLLVPVTRCHLLSSQLRDHSDIVLESTTMRADEVQASSAAAAVVAVIELRSSTGQT